MPKRLRDEVEECKNEIKKLSYENEKLRNDLELRNLEPIPGREFIKLFIEEFGKDNPNIKRVV